MPEKAAIRHEKAVGPQEELVADRLWEPNETASYLHISRSKLYALVAAGGGPPAYRIGSALRFHPNQVKAWLHDQAVVGAIA